jgi:hypothetical protein
VPKIARVGFKRFGSLLPELRLQIWEDALCVPTVWVAIRNHDADCPLGENRSPIRMKFIGPEPYLAGLACRESRRLLEQSFGKTICGPTGSATALGAYWVRLDRTVVYLGDATDAMAALASLGVDEVSRFKHVALSNSEHVAISWTRFTKLSRVCQRLAASCPALHTIIIQRDEREAGKNEALRGPLSQDMADLYAAVSEQTGPEIGYEEPCIPHLRALLLEYFGDRPPNLHLLPPKSAMPSS